jgi:hypothetical protein
MTLYAIAMRVLCVTILSGAFGMSKGAAQAPTATKFTITFQTTSNDKDWNTQVRDRIVCSNENYARLECCSADRQKDHWNDGSSELRDMTVLKAVDKSAVGACTLIVGSRANGNDRWDFVPSLRITYSDGTTEDRTYSRTSLNSRGGNETSKSYSIR